MSQTHRLTKIAVQLADTIDEYTDSIHADGLVTVQESREHQALMDRMLALLEEIDAGFAAMLSVAKGGLHARTAKDNLRDYEIVSGKVIHIHTEKHCQDGHPDSAA